MRLHPGRAKGPPQRATALQLRWAALLDERRLAGELASVRMEAIKFRLADKTWYTPDFEVVFADGSVEYHEVKGFWEDDARVKVKVASALYPDREFLAVTWNRRAHRWDEERF